MSEEKAKALGIGEFVMKPLVIMDLAKAIRRALDSREKKGGGGDKMALMETSQRIIDKAPNELLGRFSGEFIEADLERSFINMMWADYKKNTRNVLLVGGLIFIAFIGVDLLTAQEKVKMQVLFLRGIAGIFLVGSSICLQQARIYFAGFRPLFVVNQAIIVFAMMFIGFHGASALHPQFIPFIYSYVDLLLVNSKSFH